jgi:branched-subunit amino acid ABC-type transport system permease component
MCFVLIYTSTQVVNFAQGEFLLIGAWTCWWLVTSMALPFYVAFPMTFLFMMVFGIALQMIVLRPLIGEPVISVIMVTIGLSIFFQAMMKWLRRVGQALPGGVRHSRSTLRLNVRRLHHVAGVSLVIAAVRLVLRFSAWRCGPPRSISRSRRAWASR